MEEKEDTITKKQVKHTCSNCGASGKDYGDHVGILYECDGDFESLCFQQYLSTIREVKQ